MVRHDSPGVQSIALAVEDHEGLFDKLGDPVIPQPTRTPATVEEFVSQTLGLSRVAQSESRLLWQAVSKAKRHELDNLLGVEVREIAARMPALVVHASTLAGDAKMRHGVARSQQRHARPGSGRRL